MKKLIEEFKQFALKGNVIDLAVGVVVGGAFSKIVSSLVADVIMPLIGMITGKITFTDIKVTLSPPAADGSGGVFLTIGNFIQNVVDFFIIAMCIFFVIKGINTLNRLAERRKKQEAEAAATPPEPTAEVKLLMEIRDLLKKDAETEE